jgi:tRNA(Ile)-lysidine synthase
MVGSRSPGPGSPLARGRTESIAAAEADELLAPFRNAAGLVLAISGGPDSTALLWLVACWRHALGQGPAVLAVTVDHGLRPEARAEADAVKRLAKQCGVAHRTMRWTGRKPASGLPKAAREARYQLLARAAVGIGADHVLTAHTLDDQAETVLFRMSRGSGITGLAGMAALAPMPTGGDVTLARPFLDVPKARLIATVADAGLTVVDDPSNRDPRFTRARWRALMPALAAEGLEAARVGQFARRMRRAEAALEAATEAAWRTAAAAGGPDGRIALAGILAHPAEVQLRLVGRAIARVGSEGPVELGKLEALHAALLASTRARRTLAGALVTRRGDSLTIEPAPARRHGLEPRRRRNPAPLNHAATALPQRGQTALK